MEEVAKMVPAYVQCIFLVNNARSSFATYLTTAQGMVSVKMVHVSVKKVGLEIAVMNKYVSEIVLKMDVALKENAAVMTPFLAMIVQNRGVLWVQMD